MRTLELLKALSPGELKAIENQLVSGKRKSLLTLFKQLRRHRAGNAVPENEELFKKTFLKPYSKKRDYLLRNELRLLNELIYEYLAMECFKEHMARNRSLFNRWLAQSYYNRKMIPFIKDIDNFLAIARDQIQMDEASALSAIKVAFLAQYHKDENQKAQQELHDWLEVEKRRFLHRLRKIEYSQVFFNEERPDLYAGASVEEYPTPGAMTVDLSDIDKADWYARYLTLQKYYAQSKGEAQLNYHKEITNLINSDKAKNVISAESRVNNTEALAWSLFTYGKYQEAEQYLDLPIELGRKKRIEISPSHAMIRVCTLFKTGKFDKAISAYGQYKKMIEVSDSAGRAMMALAYCHLYQNKPDLAIGIFLTGKAPAEVRISSRYVFIIAFLLRDQFSLAINEMKNLRRMLKNPGQSVQVSDNDLIAGKHFHAYIQILAGKGLRKDGAVSKLRKEVQKSLASITRTPFDNHELDWLNIQLNKLPAAD